VKIEPGFSTSATIWCSSQNTSAVDTGAISTEGQNVSIRSVRIKGPGSSHEGVRGGYGAAVRLRDVDVEDVLVAAAPVPVMLLAI
jgi:hypothetical protein